MDEVLRLKGAHEPEKGLESPMAGIILIVNAQRRRMGKEDIQIAPEAQL